MKEALEKLGLSEKESAVLLALYRLGKATPTELAQETGIVRSTVYMVTENLLAQGFIAEDLTLRKQTFLALPPESLLALVSRIEQEQREKVRALESVVETLQTSWERKHIHVPKVRYIEQKQIATFMDGQIGIWNESMEKTGTDFIGYQDATYPQIFQANIESYWAHPSSKDMRLRLITNENMFEKEVMNKKSFAGRQILFWEGLGELTYSTWITGEYVVLVNTRTRPFFLIEVHDPAFAQSQRQIFEVLWKQVQP
jgi:predicted DNA-binding transcriptional regulator